MPSLFRMWSSCYLAHEFDTLSSHLHIHRKHSVNQADLLATGRLIWSPEKSSARSTALRDTAIPNIVPRIPSASRNMGLWKPHIFGKGVQQSGPRPDGLTLNLVITLSEFKMLYRHIEWESLSLLRSRYIRYNEQLIFDPSHS